MLRSKCISRTETPRWLFTLSFLSILRPLLREKCDYMNCKWPKALVYTRLREKHSTNVYRTRSKWSRMWFLLSSYVAWEVRRLLTLTQRITSFCWTNEEPVNWRDKANNDVFVASPLSRTPDETAMLRRLYRAKPELLSKPITIRTDTQMKQQGREANTCGGRQVT